MSQLSNSCPNEPLTRERKVSRMFPELGNEAFVKQRNKLQTSGGREKEPSRSGKLFNISQAFEPSPHSPPTFPRFRTLREACLPSSPLRPKAQRTFRSSRPGAAPPLTRQRPNTLRRTAGAAKLPPSSSSARCDLNFLRPHALIGEFESKQTSHWPV